MKWATHPRTLSRGLETGEILLSCLVEQLLLREDLAVIGKEVVMHEKYDRTRNESLHDIIFSETDEEVMKLRDAIEGDERLLFNSTTTIRLMLGLEDIWFEQASCGCFRA